MKNFFLQLFVLSLTSIQYVLVINAVVPKSYIIGYFGYIKHRHYSDFIMKITQGHMF